MSNSVSTAFIKQYETDVHIAYQQMGAKFTLVACQWLRNSAA